MIRALMDVGDGKTRITKIGPVAKTGTANEVGCLVMIYPPGPDMGKRFELETDEVIIGRGSDTDLQVDRDSVSRRHARVSRSPGGFLVQDLGSTNGTYVNDQPVQEQALRDGDMVKIGNTIFKFLSGGNIERDYHEEIYRMTIVDGLTGAFNKRYFLEHLEREMARCQRYARPLSLCMLDIDHFKAINDQYGHLTGDHVLKELARRLRARTRKEEIFARYGGEEFVLLLPESDHEGSCALAEQLRLLIEQEKFYFDEDEIHVTISLGVATLEPQSGGGEIKLDPDGFLRSADENLYRAKRAGRNQVVG
jgi:two-component system, cell cycle response regulator